MNLKLILAASAAALAVSFLAAKGDAAVSFSPDTMAARSQPCDASRNFRA
jgi:hypothetical protein